MNENFKVLDAYRLRVQKIIKQFELLFEELNLTKEGQKLSEIDIIMNKLYQHFNI